VSELVLIADDEEDILQLVRRVLERAGFEVMIARNGMQALELAQTRPPAVAVLDVTMPGLDGLEVVRQLRADAATAAVKVLILTARAQQADIDRATAAGADDYLAKPFNAAELRERVEALLRD
jgi:two-component system, OmpR family, phosphate regulon response regulator PhoB